MSTLLSLMNRVHLSHLHFWEGSGGGRDGLRAVVDRVVSVLEFPFMQAQTSPGSPSASPAVSAALVPGRSSPSGKVTNGELAKAMTANMHHYWQILQEVFSHCLLPET
jgi:fused-like protein